MNIREGIIIKSIAGFYYVLSEDKVYECRAKGVFRNKKIKPLTGDFVFVEEVDQSFTVSKIKDRKNEFIRPPIANLDKLFIVVSTVDPVPNFYIIDKIIAIAELKEVEPILIITKLDKGNSDNIINIYKNVGIKIIEMDYENSRIKEVILNEITNKTVSFVGNSGVGKSTLLNFLDETLDLKTDITSKKLGRGKHTTRSVTLYKMMDGFIADTPGFSSLDTDRHNIILKENVKYGFREFKEYIDECKFSDCSHIVEKGCKILEMVENGTISKSRHNSFVDIYKQSEKIKEWEL